MRYHCIIDAYSEDIIRQMEELHAFKMAFLKEAEEGVSYVLCRDRTVVEGLGRRISGSAVAIIAEDYSPESVLDALGRETVSEDIYLFGSGISGTELSVRLAARMKGSSVAAVHGLEWKEHVVVKKMVYASHMEGTFRMKKGPYCISLAKGMDRKELEHGTFHFMKEMQCTGLPESVVSRKTTANEAAGGLDEAKVVIAAGRGIRNKENADYLREAAKALGGELGVSRPAAMNAWAPMNRLIGVSGAMLQPDICITAGVSGAAAFYAGIEKSKFIVAINTDGQAPIMKKADVAVADDFVPVIKALRKLAER